MARLKPYMYKDKPENRELLRETAELLGMSQNQFVRLAIETAIKKVNYSGAMRQLRERQRRRDDDAEI